MYYGTVWYVILCFGKWKDQTSAACGLGRAEGEVKERQVAQFNGGRQERRTELI